MKLKNRWDAVVILGLWLLLWTLGCPDPPREKTTWGPRPQMERIGESNSTPTRPTPRPKFRFRDPWHDDARRNTARWQEFLEDLDEDGIILSDPDARDIWDERYD